EATGNPFLFKNENCRIDGAHPGHMCLLSNRMSKSGQPCQQIPDFSIFSKYFFIICMCSQEPEKKTFFIFGFHDFLLGKKYFIDFNPKASTIPVWSRQRNASAGARAPLTGRRRPSQSSPSAGRFASLPSLPKVQ